MFGTTKEFLEYFGLKKLEELPTLAELKEGMPELSPQTDLLESLVEADAQGVEAVLADEERRRIGGGPCTPSIEEPDEDERGRDDDSDLAGADLLDATTPTTMRRASKRASANDADGGDDAEVQSADVIPLRATEDEQ